MFLTHIGASPDLIRKALRITSDELTHAELSQYLSAMRQKRATRWAQLIAHSGHPKLLRRNGKPHELRTTDGVYRRGDPRPTRRACHRGLSHAPFEGRRHATRRPCRRRNLDGR